MATVSSSRLRRGLVTATVVAGAVLQVLDMTIANVALPHMQAALGATPETVTWVLTSYILASAVAMPITGWLEARMGRRNLFVLSVLMFTISSAVCGAAHSMEVMVLARIVQGIFGAFIIPVGQAALLDSSPEEEWPRALLIWVMGMMAGPIMGPFIGGWITDAYDWRWIFYVNVPFGCVIALGGWLLLSSPPLEKRHFDMMGFLYLAVALGAFQLLLDRGTPLDWFDSTEIIIEAGVAIAAAWMFIIHSGTAKAPLIPLALYANRNLMLASLFMLIAAGVVFGGTAMLAPLLQHLMGYDTLDTGLMMMPRAIASLVGLIVASRLADRVDARLFVALGLGLICLSLWMLSGISLEADGRLFIWSGAIQGFGTGITMMPVQVLAFQTLSAHLRTEGAAIFHLARNLGSSFVISMTSALLARNVQISHADLSAHIIPRPPNPAEAEFLAGLSGSATAALHMLDAEINRQALMIAYIDNFWIMMIGTVLVIPMALLLSRSKPSDDVRVSVME